MNLAAHHAKLTELERRLSRSLGDILGVRNLISQGDKLQLQRGSASKTERAEEESPPLSKLTSWESKRISSLLTVNIGYSRVVQCYGLYHVVVRCRRISHKDRVL
jgi:hypothetical protein